MDLLGEPAPSFDDPVGLLLACHQRIQQHCDILERIPSYVDQKGVDEELRAAVTRILRYFDLAGPAHHADEELVLFSWLLQQPGFPSALRAPLRNLAEQHRLLEAAWQDLAGDLHSLIALEKPMPLRLEPFVSMNRAHIALENAEMFPVARELLDADTAKILGMTMVQRRREMEVAV
ncbi:hemerythrin domain-containing protein [Acidithiobacillus sp.]|uniref:hemerythrin domain-containing protein n=1 Tax=Acidithiobacillus sp. TaxID=1872118 RepID=UPI0025BDD5E5|nr:hemerythrin domain-containing protein [Acidithiobacillus sp.]